ncbi:energy transducer TonB [Hymenobacter gummosus]|uniref:Energy transducer TonB n=1 Tax=Hymenobacter gummosus TaxID=1776032 RepID=A0A431U9B8_9BACT|nr:energy transducer TonB [Hymenobacter gummosus]RTQ53687.1 energy transducer TonB [Hymenobacter gummosus]
MPGPHSSRPSAETDQALIWLFGLALGLLLLLRWWPEEEPAPDFASTYPETSTVYEQPAATYEPPSATYEPTPADPAPEPAPPSQDEWQQGNQFLKDGRAASDWNAPAADPAAERLFTEVEQMPEPPGGAAGLAAYLRDNVKYPAEARHNGVSGKVLVTFVVGADGQVREARVHKGLGAGCDKEAVQAVSRMPAWTPGRQNGQAVSVQYTVPVTFPPNW